MLKKLYKHEFSSLFRTLWPAYAGLMALAVLSRISFFFNTDSNAAVQSSNAIYYMMNTAKSAVIVFYSLGIFAIFVVSLVMIVTRFYKHLLSSQGYLSFTLPVTPTDHILCKLICGTVMMILSFIGVLISLAILATGYNFLPEIFSGMGQFFKSLNQEVGALQSTVLIVGVIVGGILMIVNLLTSIYASISLGQQFKNRIGAAVLIYIGMSMAVQFVASITAIPTLIYNIDSFSYNTSAAVANFFTVSIVVANCLSLALSVGMFFITRHMLTKKLDLE